MIYPKKSLRKEIADSRLLYYPVKTSFAILKYFSMVYKKFTGKTQNEHSELHNNQTEKIKLNSKFNVFTNLLFVYFFISFCVPKNI